MENFQNGNISTILFFFFFPPKSGNCEIPWGCPCLLSSFGGVWIHQVWARCCAAVMGGHMREQHHRLLIFTCIKHSSSEVRFSTGKATLPSTIFPQHSCSGPHYFYDHWLQFEMGTEVCFGCKLWIWERKSDKYAILMLQNLMTGSRGKSVALFFRNKNCFWTTELAYC